MDREANSSFLRISKYTRHSHSRSRLRMLLLRQVRSASSRLPYYRPSPREEPFARRLEKIAAARAAHARGGEAT